MKSFNVFITSKTSIIAHISLLFSNTYTSGLMVCAVMLSADCRYSRLIKKCQHPLPSWLVSYLATSVENNVNSVVQDVVSGITRKTILKYLHPKLLLLYCPHNCIAHFWHVISIQVILPTKFTLDLKVQFSQILQGLLYV